MHYHEECSIESHDENHEVFMMKTVQSSYLHLSNILSSQIELSSRVVESSFSIWFEFSDSTSQFNLILFQKNFNSTQHFLSQVLDLNLSTQLDAISLKKADILVESCFIYHKSDHSFKECFDQSTRINAVNNEYDCFNFNSNFNSKN